MRRSWYARIDPVNTRDIRTTDAHTSCDVCGRTLLRGERAEIYIHGGARRSVCELCTARALHEGWVREGTVPPSDGREARSDRRRSLLGRLRAASRGRLPSASPTPTSSTTTTSLSRSPRAGPRATAAAPPARRSRSDGSARSRVTRQRERVREPRHVRAIPTSVEHKIASAVELFNGSEHRRTIAGVARSLGAPTVSVRPADESASLVNLVASWELCWYRYEVDLSDEDPERAAERAGLRARRARAGRAHAERGRRRARLADPQRLSALTRTWTIVRWSSNVPVIDSIHAVIYCVVPQALADELFDKLTELLRRRPQRHRDRRPPQVLAARGGPIGRGQPRASATAAARG